jgi:hypothetical protein
VRAQNERTQERAVSRVAPIDPAHH